MTEGPDFRPPISQDEPWRVRMTLSCDDCADVPKVAGAGHVEHVDGEQVQLMHNGLRVQAGGYFGDWMQTIITELQGHHEPQEELVFREVMARLPETATMIELGAYWSYYTLWFLSASPGTRRAVALEPDPTYIEVGRHNAELNGLHPQFVQGCVGAVAEDSVPFLSDTAGTIDIPQFTVEQLMENAGLERLTLLHSDTQGAETSVLTSCRGLVESGRLDWLVVSTHSHHISGDPLTHQRCIALIEEMGGQVLVEHTVHESYSGDGLIVAYFGADEIDWAPPPMSRNRVGTSLFRDPLYDLAEAQEQIVVLQEQHRADQALLQTAQERNAALRSRVRRLRARVKRAETPPPRADLPRRVARRAQRTATGLARRIGRS